MTIFAMRLVVVSIVGLLAACEVSPEQRAEDVCTAVCQCTFALPSQVDTCVDSCVPNVNTVSDECLDCVYTYSQTCTQLFAMCEDPCQQQQPQPQPQL